MHELTRCCSNPVPSGSGVRARRRSVTGERLPVTPLLQLAECSVMRVVRAAQASDSVPASGKRMTLVVFAVALAKASAEVRVHQNVARPLDAALGVVGTVRVREPTRALRETLSSLRRSPTAANLQRIPQSQSELADCHSLNGFTPGMSNLRLDRTLAEFSLGERPIPCRPPKTGR